MVNGVGTVNNLTLGSGAKLTIPNADSLKVTGSFTESSGKTTDNGSLSASGGVSLRGGSLFGTGSITGGVTSSTAGTVTPGASSTTTGILKVAGTYTQNAGTLDILIKGTTAGAQYDQLNPTKANLSGTLNIGRSTGFVPTIGSTFKIMNFTSETGKFSTVKGLAINSSEHFTIAYQGSDVLLTVASGALPGGASALVSRLSGPAASAAVPEPRPETLILFGLTAVFGLRIGVRH